MTISFDNIPANTLVPLFWAETKPAPAPFLASLKLLLIGRKTSLGTASTNVPYILSGDRADQLFGRGSNLSWMYRKARENAPLAEIWGMAAEEAAGSAFATGFVKVTTPPSASKSGTLNFWIGAKLVSVIVKSTDSAAATALKIKNAINANSGHYVTAAIDGTDSAKVLLTCKWKGSSGNHIWITFDRFGENRLATQILTQNGSTLTGGLGEASFTAGLAALGEKQFDVISIPFTTTGYLDAVDDFMDGESGRWSPSQQIYGHVFSASTAGFADLINIGAARNGPHVSIMGASASPSPPWEWSAVLGAQAVQHLDAPPEVSRPMQTVALKGLMVSPNMAYWHDVPERQSLLEAGISTHTVDADGTIRINRLVTMRKTNVWGSPDSSWRDVNTLFQAMFFVRSMRARITGTFPRAALTNEETGINGFASPGQIRDVLVHEYKRLARQGLVENPDLFARALVVERNEFDANRVDILMRPDMVNQLTIVAALVETYLQLTDEDVALIA